MRVGRTETNLRGATATTPEPAAASARWCWSPYARAPASVQGRTVGRTGCAAVAAGDGSAAVEARRPPHSPGRCPTASDVACWLRRRCARDQTAPSRRGCCWRGLQPQGQWGPASCDASTESPPSEEAGQSDRTLQLFATRTSPAERRSRLRLADLGRARCAERCADCTGVRRRTQTHLGSASRTPSARRLGPSVPPSAAALSRLRSGAYRGRLQSSGQSWKARRCRKLGWPTLIRPT
mmetsp:Transcript_62720/g.110769  ORF Transcript_62720/g.110769 Transcript_62720/m.110769 type:complete len:238 (-) Transcript_62720:587-1300(-)